MPDSIDSLHGQILDEAFAYADSKADEVARHERNFKQIVQESTVLPRVRAAAALRNIERLTREVRSRGGT